MCDCVQPKKRDGPTVTASRPGLARRDQLPPGLEKQLRRNGTLPPGLRKHLQPFPVELKRQLALLPAGYRRVVIGDTVIIMDDRTSIIHDLIQIAIR